MFLKGLFKTKGIKIYTFHFTTYTPYQTSPQSITPQNLFLTFCT